jgi:transcriptional regulator with XRE-family HTH domain
LLFPIQRIFDDGLVTKPIGADVKRRSRTPNEVFGRAVTEKRLERELSQATLAETLGYSTYYLGRIERGNANVSCDVMGAISGYFGLTIGEFWIFAEGLARQTKQR